MSDTVCSLLSYIGGPDSTRNCDLLNANQAFYQLNYKPVLFYVLAEEVGFEPTIPFGMTVFKTARFSHSRIPPFEV